MATIVGQTTELPMKLRLSRQASEKLTQRGAESGRDVADVASELVEQAVNRPTVDEVLAPFRKQVAESGMSDKELDAFLEGVREKAFQERQRRPE
jgi:hypothetical protein